MDPFWSIIGLIAIATVLLFPIRMWILSRYDRDEGEEETPLAPPERRNRG